MRAAAHQDRLRAALPEARFETFAGSSHSMCWETPETVGPLVSGFLAP